jgi:FkbM family methyltransferase
MFFSGVRNGVFLDVGAHDGKTFSNTLFFEKELNWTGICVEPLPTVYERLKVARSCVCVLGCAYDMTGELKFTTVNGHSEMLSGVTNEYCQEHQNRIEYEIKVHGGSTKEIVSPCYRIQDLCDKHNIKHVNFMSIDTEGSELNVLRGIDYKQTQFDVMLIEIAYPRLLQPIQDFLATHNIIFHSMLDWDAVFVHKNFTHNQPSLKNQPITTPQVPAPATVATVAAVDAVATVAAVVQITNDNKSTLATSKTEPAGPVAAVVPITNGEQNRTRDATRRNGQTRIGVERILQPQQSLLR